MVSNQKDADDEIEVCHGDIFENIVAVSSSRGLFYSGIVSPQLDGRIPFNSQDPIMGRRVSDLSSE
jgi:hypothetical protein